VVVVALVVVVLSGLIALAAGNIREPDLGTALELEPQEVPTFTGPTLPVPTAVSFPGGPDGRAVVHVCTPLGSATMSMVSSPEMKGPKRPLGQGPEVVSLWLATDFAEGYAGEVTILTGLGGFGTDAASIAIGASDMWGPDDSVTVERTDPRPVGQHVEFDSTTRFGNGSETRNRVIGRPELVLMLTVTYTRDAYGTATFAGVAEDELQRMVDSLRFPGLDGSPEGDTCPRPTPVAN
jgi:hypothetical protein